MRTRILQLAVLSLMVGATGAAATIFYGVDLSVGSTGLVTGFIETDGTIGTLGAGNFVDWSLKITDGVHTPDTLLGPLSGNNSFVAVNLSDQSATSSAILFNFSASDGGYFFFERNTNSDFVCFGPGGGTGFNSTCALGAGSNVEGISLGTSEQNTPLTGTQIVAAVPEPASVIFLATGLSLGVFLRLRRR